LKKRTLPRSFPWPGYRPWPSGSIIQRHGSARRDGSGPPVGADRAEADVPEEVTGQHAPRYLHNQIFGKRCPAHQIARCHGGAGGGGCSCRDPGGWSDGASQCSQVPRGASLCSPIHKSQKKI
jgi:hypothetical protein